MTLNPQIARFMDRLEHRALLHALAVHGHPSGRIDKQVEIIPVDDFDL